MPSRIGAGTYTLTMSIAMMAWALATLYATESLVPRNIVGLSGLHYWVGAFGVAVGMLFFPLSARRLRDLNFPGWSVNILAIPFLGVIMLPVLCFLSGPRWTNDYGDPPTPSSTLKIVFVCVLFLVATSLTYSALRAYHVATYWLTAGKL